MKINKINNLFNYATTELSQDAFLCWLFSYALKEADEDKILTNCAKDFLNQFIGCNYNFKDIWLSNPPERQHNSIDVLLTVNDRYKIIIEDKTYTKEHNNQLERYRDSLSKEYPDYIIKCVFLKTGFQSDHSEIIRNGYKYFGIKDILKTLEKYVTDQTNVILISYYEYIKTLYNEINNYKFLPISKWNWAQINGFFDDVKNDKSIIDNSLNCNYGYVPNQSGGFYGMWIGNNTFRTFNGIQYELYLQCEFSNGEFNICYKASNSSNKKIGRDAREYFVWKEDNGWVNVAEKNGFIKPSRYGCGKTVTLGFFKGIENQFTYIQLKDNLRKAINAFKNTIKELSI